MNKAVQEGNKVWLTLESSLSLQTPDGRWVKVAGSLGRSEEIDPDLGFTTQSAHMFTEISTVLDHLLNTYQEKNLK